jgi:four helix bundle protein
MKDEAPRTPVDLRKRTKAFALRVIRVYSALPRSTLGQVLGRQLVRAGTSVGAHYREAHRGRSDAEFISKIEGGLQELEEAAYWMELIVESGLLDSGRMGPIMREAEELLASLTACVMKVKRQHAARPGKPRAIRRTA